MRQGGQEVNDLRRSGIFDQNPGWGGRWGAVSLAVLFFVFSILFFSVFSSMAGADPRALPAYSGKLVKPGQLTIDGYLVRCGATPALISETYPDFGAARRGLIILNPQRLRSLTHGAKLLVYYHECAHQYVGGSELAADCWAVQKVRREGLMSRAGLKKACRFIERLPANRRHPPGTLRCRQMMRCYNETFRTRADREERPDVAGVAPPSSRGFSGSDPSGKGSRDDHRGK